jgi:3-phenylpropionate/trans-cinnamate dioxygenase ferredoxin reductase subunit
MAESGIVVVGGGLAGARAVEAARGAGYDGSITLLAAESEAPYERPALSKGFLTGAKSAEDILALPTEWYSDNDVDLRTGTEAVQLDLDARMVGLADGTAIAFDRLLLATGAEPRRLDVPGADDVDLLYLRTLDDARALRSALDVGGRRVAIIGGGWIGLEVAAAARNAGNDVVVIEPEPTPLHAALGPELGDLFARLHRHHGVDVRTGGAVERVAATAGGAELTVGGEQLQADVVVVGIGARPRVALAADAGLEVASGIRTDANLQTAAEGVFAAGDVAEPFNPLLQRPLRVDHWANALNTGKVAGRNLAGESVSYDRVPYFYTDQFELGMEFSGIAAPGDYDRVVYRGRPESLEFIAFWLSGDRVVAGMNVNVWDVTEEIQGLIKSGRPVTVERLVDAHVPLGEV